MNTVADRDLDVKSCVAGSVQTGVCTNTEIIVRAREFPAQRWLVRDSA